MGLTRSDSGQPSRRTSAPTIATLMRELLAREIHSQKSGTLPGSYPVFRKLKLYEKRSIHSELYPRTRWKETYRKYTRPLVDFNGDVWKMKKEKGLSLSSPITSEIPSTLRPFEDDLRAMHKISLAR